MPVRTVIEHGTKDIRPFLIRHSAFHTLDHGWEMEDKDLSGESGI